MSTTTTSVVQPTEHSSTHAHSRSFAEADVARVWNYWFGRRATAPSTTPVADPYADAYRLDHTLWFHAGAEVGAEVAQHFGELMVGAARGALDGWQESARGGLALVLLLGHLPRVAFRGSPRAYASDAQALRLARSALDRGLDRQLSPGEALFFFLALAQSEDVADLRRALDGVAALETRCPQRQQRAAKSWRVEVLKRLDVLERFGRDPARNEALGRETTAAERAFLARPEYADLFARAQLPGAGAVEAREPAASTAPTHRRLKVLVLHGLRQNGAVFRARAKKMRRALADLADLHFATSPLPYVLSGATREAALEALGEVPDFPAQQAWWHPSDDNRRYEGFDASVAYLEGVCRDEGPFDGVIGFSQGGTLAAVLAAMQPRPAIAFRFAVCISAFPSRAEAHAAYVRPGSVALPSLHIYGEKDLLVTPERSKALFELFDPSTARLVKHGGGHFVPGAWPLAEIRDFIDGFVDRTAPAVEAAPEEAPDPLVEVVRSTLSASPVDAEALHGALEELASRQQWAELRQAALDAHARRTSADGADADALRTAHDDIVELFARQLNRDLHALAARADERGRTVASLLGGSSTLASAEPWPSPCARFAPRVGTGPDKACRLARDIARELFPVEDMASRIAAMGPGRVASAEPAAANGHARRREPQSLDAASQARNLSYQNYGQALSHLRNALAEMEPGYASAQLQRFQRARQFSPALIESLLDRPVSTRVSEPEPEPVVPCALADLDPLLAHLSADAPVAVQTAFNKGTLTTDGRLDLCKQVVGPRGIVPLLDAMKRSQRVKRLLLGNNIVGDGGASAIAEYIRAGAPAPLECWYIAGNHIGPEGIATVCDALADDPHVTSLWLKRNPLKAAGMAPLAALLRANRTLEVLDVVNCGLLDEGLAVLLGGLMGPGANKTLKHLYLGTNGVSERSAPLLAEYLANDCALESLYLSCNRLGDEGVAVIARALASNRSLRRVSFASNRVGPKGAAALAEALAEQPTLQLLDLGFTKATVAVGELGNYVGDEGARSLAQMLTTNRALRVLDLLHNYISQAGVNHLRAALATNRTLVSLQLTQFGRVHNEPGKEEIRAALARNLALVPEAEREAVTKVELPDHIGDIYSVYRTHS